MKSFPLFVMSIAVALSAVAKADNFDYTDGAVTVNGDVVTFESDSFQDATFVSKEAYSGALEISAEYLGREMFPNAQGNTGAYQAGLVLFFAKPEDDLASLTGNDNTFELFERKTVASIRDKLFPTINHCWFYLKNLGKDGSLVSTQDGAKYQMLTGGAFKLVRDNGFIEAYHYHDDAWQLIADPQELPDEYKTSPLKIGMRIKREWMKQYSLKVQPALMANGNRILVDPAKMVTTRNATPPSKPGSGGDPHFKTWTGKKFDYHGECDLVLVDHPSYNNGQGLKIHIRTTRVKVYSYIETIAVQIGTETLEFSNDIENFLINNKKVEANKKGHKTRLAGHIVRRNPKVLSIRLGSDAQINLFYRKNGFPYVQVDAKDSDIFVGSTGLLGDYNTGNMIGRDGTTEINDSSDFAQEWQVRDNEPMLFSVARFPQYPTKCTPPSKMLGKRLGDSHMKEAAEKACANWGEDKDECVFDVMATRSIGHAEPLGKQHDIDVAVAYQQ